MKKQEHVRDTNGAEGPVEEYLDRPLNSPEQHPA